MPIPVICEERSHNRYCPLIAFTNIAPIEESWSADIFVKSQISQYESIAKLSYLSDAAPFEQLQKGACFELYEGNKLVATGEICAEWDQFQGG